jgi:hypothetical protein
MMVGFPKSETVTPRNEMQGRQQTEDQRHILVAARKENHGVLFFFTLCEGDNMVS